MGSDPFHEISRYGRCETDRLMVEPSCWDEVIADPMRLRLLVAELAEHLLTPADGAQVTAFLPPHLQYRPPATSSVSEQDSSVRVEGWARAFGDDGNRNPSDTASIAFKNNISFIRLKANKMDNRIKKERSLVGLFILSPIVEQATKHQNNAERTNMIVSTRENVDMHVGYLLGKAYWGQGLASELLRGWVAHLQNDELGKYQGTVFGGVDRQNPASARVLVKAGFAAAPSQGEEVVWYQRTFQHENEAKDACEVEAKTC